MNKLRQERFLLVIFFLVLFSGCKPSRAEIERQVVNLGAVFFYFYLFVCTIHMVTPYLHSLKGFQDLKVTLRTPAIVASIISILLGVLLFFGGHGAEGLKALHVYIGVIWVSLGLSLFFWTQLAKSSQQTAALKISSLSAGFLIALYFLMYKGAELIEILR